MIKRIKRFVLATLRQLRLEYLPKWRRDSFALREHLKGIFERTNPGAVIDVGANAGQYYEFIRNEVGFKGWIISFEPVPHLARELAARASGDSRWLVYQAAIGSADGVADFHVMSDSQFSSFLTPNESAREQFRMNTEVVETVPVPVHRLDSILPEVRKVAAFDSFYLKIDTQGFDLEVLRGASESLKNAVSLQTELSFSELYSGSHGYREIISVLEDIDFGISGVFTINLNSVGALIEADGVFVPRGRRDV